MSDDGPIAVDTEALRYNASRIDTIAADLQQVVDAAATTTNLDAAIAFGVMCQGMGQIAIGLTRIVSGNIANTQQLIGATADQARKAADRFDAYEESTIRDVRRIEHVLLEIPAGRP